MKRGHFPLATLEERFLVQVDKSDGCWIWTGTIGSNGYGLIKDNYRTRTAHRVSYELHKGPIPQGLMICHTCDVKACVNPEHLYAGDAFDNMRDKKERGRQNIRRGTRHPHAKLTEADIVYIRTSGKRGAALAREYDMKPSTMSQIKRGLRWKHVRCGGI